MKPPRLLVLITIAFFTIIIIIPIIYIIWLVVSDLTFQNIFEGRHIILLKNSLIISLGTTFFSLILGVPSAFLISQLQSNKYRFMILLCSIISLLIPPYIQAIVWSQLSIYIKKYINFINIYNFEGAIFILTLSYFSYITLLTFTGLQSIDRNHLEVALLSQNKWKSLVNIILPMLMPYIFAGAIFVFIFSIIDFGIPDMLRLNVYPVEIFIQYSAFYNDRAAIILSFPIILLTATIVILQKVYMKNRSYIQIYSGYQNLKPIYSTKWLSTVTIPTIFLSSIVPIIVLLTSSGNFSNYMNALVTSKNQFFFTIMISAMSAFFILIFSLFLAIILERSNHIYTKIIHSIALIPLAIPAITIGICMITIWNQKFIDFVYSSSIIIVLAYTFKFLPFAVILIISSLKNINKNLEESACLSTSSWFRVMNNITFSLLKPSLLFAFFVIFILSIGELGTTVLIMPPGRETITLKIFNYMHYSDYKTVNALCLILIFIILGLSGLAGIIYKKVLKVNFS